MFPFRALVKRELVSSLRRARIFVWMVAILMCCIGVVWVSWPEPSSSPTRVEQSMTEILALLALVMLGGCVLFIPSVAASAIVSEREQDTLDLLRMSLMRASGIVFAKFLNALGLFALLLVAVAPAIGASLFGVGLERATVIQVLIALATVALTCTLAGLVSSAFFRRTIWAVMSGYALTALALALPAVVLALVSAFIWWAPEYAIRIQQFIRSPGLTDILFDTDGVFLLASPVTALVVIFGQRLSGWWILVSAGFQVPIWLLFAWLTMRWLRKRDPQAVVQDDKPIDDLELLRARREQFPYYLIDPLKRKKPIEDSRNPMFVREVRWGLFSRLTILMRLCLAIFAMFFIGALFPVFYDSGRATDTEIIRMWAAVQYFITMLFAPALVANTFTKERELGNFDMMRMTLMRPRQILAGKAAAGFVVLSPVIVAVLVASIPLLFIGVRALPELGMSVVTGLVWAAFCVAVSITVSLFARRTISAMITSYGIVAFTYLVLNFLVEFLWVSYANKKGSLDVFSGSASGYLRTEPPWIDAITALNPATSVLDRFGQDSWIVNTSVALVVVIFSYAMSYLILTRYRMQDR